MKRLSIGLIALATAFAMVPAALADTVIYQATNYTNEGLNFGPDGTANPPVSGNYWELGNTITFGAASSYTLGSTSVDLTLYGGGDTTYPVEMQIYSGNNPNTGTLLGTAYASAGYGTNTTVFDFAGLVVPDTITYILSLPDETGSYDSVMLYPILTSNSAPTVGSSTDAVWYGTAPGNFVSNSTYAVADGDTNYLAAEFTSVAPTPEPNSLLLLGTGLLGVVFAARRKIGLV